jgi:hypothetical protein
MIFTVRMNKSKKYTYNHEEKKKWQEKQNSGTYSSLHSLKPD